MFNFRCMTSAVLLLVPTVLGHLLSANEVKAAGALAFGQGEQQEQWASGSAFDASTQPAADAAALRSCEQRAVHGEQCKIVARFYKRWVTRQVTEAFPWDMAPRYMIRDRDRIYGIVVRRRLRAMGIRDKPTAPASPWQNGFAERLIGSIRRECVDHIIVLGEAHLRRVLKSYADYHNSARTHRSLDKDAPVSRPVQRTGVISSRAILGGLHHRYARV
jgi:hypothetical protein